MRIGCNVSINVDKIEKTRLFQGQKGRYLNLKVFLDTEQQSEYGDNGTVSQSTSKEEYQNGVKMPIIGNAKIFYKQDSEPMPESNYDQDGQIDDGSVPF